ncbi:MAG: ABC transporter permease [Deltaproteobacteria bacterium]|nr:ABC transporter permease [Deltaproteobacteria bacterium]
MARSTPERRRKTLVKTLFGSYYVLFLIFIYGPMFAMFTLSFQAQQAGINFPMKGFSIYWWRQLFDPNVMGSLHQSLVRSLVLAIVVMVLTALLSTMLAMAYRQKFFGSGVLFYTIMTGLMLPGILVGLGVSLLTSALKIPPAWWFTGLGVQLVWSLPFGFLIMLAVFNRFDSRLEEAARDMGASEWTVFREITLPLILPGVISAGLFGFTLSYDEFPRTMLLSGESNTLPLDIYSFLTQRVRPSLFAMGTASTLFSVFLIVVFLVVYTYLSKRTR